MPAPSGGEAMLKCCTLGAFATANEGDADLAREAARIADLGLLALLFALRLAAAAPLSTVSLLLLLAAFVVLLPPPPA